MSNLNIYQIEQEYISIANAIIEADGEITEEQIQSLEINKEELENKGRSYGYVIKQMEAECSIIDAEIKRLSDLKSSRGKVVDRLKETVKDAMILYEIDKIETATLKLSLRKSESVNISDIEELDQKFITVKITKQPDKKAIKEAIKEAIKAGETVDGATLESNKSLQIK